MWHILFLLLLFVMTYALLYIMIYRKWSCPCTFISTISWSHDEYEEVQKRGNIAEKMRCCIHGFEVLKFFFDPYGSLKLHELTSLHLSSATLMKSL